jgi:hypothetical protein
MHQLWSRDKLPGSIDRDRPVTDEANGGRGRDLGLLEGDRDGKRPGPAMAAAGYFPPRAGDVKTHHAFGQRALHREAK